MEILGFRIPPLEKQLQVLSAWYWIVSFLVLRILCAGLLLYVAFFTTYSQLAFLYMCWAYYDKETPSRGGRKIPFLMKFRYWKYFNDYFPIKLIKTGNISADKNYIFCYYPHGVLPAGMFGCFGNDLSDYKNFYPGLKMHCATLDMNFDYPFFREYCMGISGITSSKESLRYVLDDKNKGNVVVLAIGGATESLYATPGPYRIVLKNRRGFIKIALENGAGLVPVFAFGEIDLYKQYNPPGSKLFNIQLWLKKYLGFAPVMPVGRGIVISTGLVPFNSPVNVVVGNAIEVPKISNPTAEDIEKYHTLFSEELIKLFNDHKNKYAQNAENSELIIQ